jgi:hypothetical protein
MKRRVAISYIILILSPFRILKFKLIPPEVPLPIKAEVFGSSQFSSDGFDFYVFMNLAGVRLVEVISFLIFLISLSSCVYYTSVSYPWSEAGIVAYTRGKRTSI